MRWDATPAASSARARAVRNAPTSATTSSYCGACCIVEGVPFMCMTMSPACVFATASTAPGARKAVTSFTTAQPASIAARITSGFNVSTETATPSFASASTTGITRRNSSSRATGAAPGRVDSPPTSMKSAPSSRNLRPCVIAWAGSRNRPPSEKESAVTFTMPSTFGRPRRKRGGPWPPLRSRALPAAFRRSPQESRSAPRRSCRRRPAAASASPRRAWADAAAGPA